MSELSRNQLSSRRGFLQRTLGTATLAGAGSGIFTGIAKAGQRQNVNPWAYDDSQYRVTDPKLIRFQESRRFSIAHQSPRCICLAKDEHLFIGAGRHVEEHALDGTLVSEFTLTEDVRCLAVSADNQIYVGLRDHVEVYDRKGQHRASWESPGKKSYLTALAVAESDLFAADAGNRLVVRYELSGKIKGRIGESTSESKSRNFIVPSPFFDVEVAPDGLLRISNPGRHRVDAYTFAGELEFSWGNPGASIENFCGCCNPINLAPMSDGRIVTFEKGIPRVKVYNSHGQFESVVAGSESFVENAKICGPNDCTLGGLDGVVDSKGRIHILDLVSANVRTMEPKANA